MAEFERCADATLDEVRATYAARGEEYRDTWAVENNVSTFTRSVLRDFLGTSDPDPKIVRLLLAAALVDVKDARMLGPYKRDSVIDGVAYRALFAQLREELQPALDPIAASADAPAAPVATPVRKRAVAALPPTMELRAVARRRSHP